MSGKILVNQMERNILANLRAFSVFAEKFLANCASLPNLPKF